MSSDFFFKNGGKYKIFLLFYFCSNENFPSLYAAMSFKLWRCIPHDKYTVVTMWTDVLTTEFT